MDPTRTLHAFDRFLAQRGLRLDAIVVGGTALSRLPWLEVQDLNPDWPAHVRATLADLARRLGHGV